MASACVPEGFYEFMSHHWPPEQPVGAQGGRPRVAHRLVMKVIGFVPATGCLDGPLLLLCGDKGAYLWEREPARRWALC